ncbi:MAG: TRAP transporter small permease [Bacteroidetes bacterium]|nr:MAG: TRAP transporter small permease [Bacteroidota bacterium]
MKAIQLVSRYLSYLERGLIIVLLSTMVLLSFTQVILRNLFSTGFLWADPLLRHAVLWIGFIGASLAAQQEKHINIDALTRFTSPRVTNLIKILTSLFPVVVCYFLAQAGWTFLLDEMESGMALFSIGETEYPAWWFETVIPFGFGLIGFRFFLKAIEHIILAFKPHDPALQSSEMTTPHAR